MDEKFLFLCLTLHLIIIQLLKNYRAQIQHWTKYLSWKQHFHDLSRKCFF